MVLLDYERSTEAMLRKERLQTGYMTRTERGRVSGRGTTSPPPAARSRANDGMALEPAVAREGHDPRFDREEDAMTQREQQPYEGEEAAASGTEEDLEDELPDVPGVTPADDPPERS